MKKVLPLLLLITFLVSSVSFSQQLSSISSQKEILKNNFAKKGEVYFRFYSNSKKEINNLSRIISIDKVSDKIIYFEVYAYASQSEFDEFAKRNLLIEVLKHPGDNQGGFVSDNIDEITGVWNVYPTYPAYVQMMNSFATAYPNLCKIVNIGSTVSNRSLLFAVISDSVNTRKPKPRFMYSSSMHGDETTGYVLMLRLIDTLLSGYGNEQLITKLVKNCEIWINPLANPDGTYYGGDNTVLNSRRYNQNGYDINRNFPDPVAGPNPTGTWQPETIAMMNLFGQYNFTLSMNFHGGAEVYNYPWDSKSALHPDDAWWINVGKRYVDTVHKYSPSTYLDDLLGYPNIGGITNGYAWYSVAGGRQDFMTYFKGGREVTLEISSTKLVSAANLPTYWGYNFKSFLGYINESLKGIRGIVTDSVTGLPIKSKIFTSGQTDTTWIYSDTVCGDYHRMLNAGTYTLTFKAPNYYPKTVSGIQVFSDSAVVYNVQLRPIATNIINEQGIVNNFTLYQNYPNPFNPETNIKFNIKEDGLTQLKIYDISGKEIRTLINENLAKGIYTYKFNASDLTSGVYFYKLTSGNFTDTKKLLLIK